MAVTLGVLASAAEAQEESKEATSTGFSLGDTLALLAFYIYNDMHLDCIVLLLSDDTLMKCGKYFSSNTRICFLEGSKCVGVQISEHDFMASC